MASTPFLDCHLEKDLVVACAVDLALVLNNKFAALIDYFLLLRCQAVVNILVDAEEQAS